MEDPEADLAALQLPLGSTIVTISSGGCNALSYLTGEAGAGLRHRLNEAHLSLLKLKLAACALSRNTPISGSFLARAPRLQFEPLSPAAAAVCSMPMRRLLGQAQRGRNVRGTPYFTDGFLTRHGMLALYRPCPFAGEMRPD